MLCLIPCFNEGAAIERLVSAMPACVSHTLVVDDGSDDGTGATAVRAGATVLRHESRRGVGAALRDGYGWAVREGFDCVVVLAGNGKDDPREVPHVIEPIVAEVADFVQGSRWLGADQPLGAMPLYRRVATRVHPLLFGLATGRFVTESTNGFRALHRRVLEDPRLSLEGLDGYQLEPSLYAQVIALGYRTVEVPVRKVYPHQNGATVTKMQPVVGWGQLITPLVRAALTRRGRPTPS